MTRFLSKKAKAGVRILLLAVGMVLSLFYSCSGEDQLNIPGEKISGYDQFKSCFYHYDAPTLYLDENASSTIRAAAIQYPDSIYTPGMDFMDSIEVQIDYDEQWQQNNVELMTMIPDELSPIPGGWNALAHINLAGGAEGFLVTNHETVQLLIYKNEVFRSAHELSTYKMDYTDSLFSCMQINTWITTSDTGTQVWAMGYRYTYDASRDEYTAKTDTSWYKILEGDKLVDRPQDTFPDTLVLGLKQSRAKKNVHDDYRELYATTQPFDFQYDTLHVYCGMQPWSGEAPYERTYSDYMGDYLGGVYYTSHPGFFQPERFVIELDFYGLYRFMYRGSGATPDKKYIGIIFVTESGNVDLALLDRLHPVSRIPLAWIQDYSDHSEITESLIYRDQSADEIVVLQKWATIEGEETGIRKFVLDNNLPGLKEVIAGEELVSLFNIQEK